MKHNRFGYLVKEGFKSIFTHGFMSFASVTIIVACLLIMGSFTLLAVNIDSVIDDFEQKTEILAFVDDALSDEEAMELQKRIEVIDNVKSVEFVSDQQAMENFISQYDEEDRESFAYVTSDFFRHRYVIYMDDIALMESTAEDVMAVNGIAEVSDSLELSHGFITARNVVSVISFILIVILFIVSVFIMSNTIKLATFSRKEEIAIMKMVGAGNAFIRCPFIVEGLVLGLIGGGIAFLLQWGVYNLVFGKVVTSIVGTLIGIIPFSALMYPVLGVFLAVGLVVGVFGSSIAIRNYLKV
ncbi:MAG: permease-like cell division protein FtsX [Oscillospiraceae bacterium]